MDRYFDAGEYQKEKIGQKCYYIATIIMTMKVIIDYSSWINISGKLDNVLIVLSLSMFFYEILRQGYQLQEIVFIALGGIICLYSSVKCDSYNLMMSYFFIIASKHVKIEKAVMAMHYTKLVLVSLHILVYTVDVFALGKAAKVISRGEGKLIRHSFYMSHPNVLAMFVLWIILEWLFLNYEKIKLSHISIWAFITAIVYYNTDSRTFIIVNVVMLLFMLIKNLKEELHKKMLQISQYIFVIIGGLVLTMVYFYAKTTGAVFTFLSSVSKLLSERISLGSYALETYGFTLLGSNINFDLGWSDFYKTDTLIIDNGYVVLAVNQGFIYLFIIALAFYCVSRASEDRVKLLIIAFSLFALTESFIVNAFLCFPLIFISMLLFRKKE